MRQELSDEIPTVHDESLTFTQLIMSLEDQQEWAVQKLVERYGSHIFRVVRRHLGQKLRIRFDSEDFVQAVWATLFVKPQAFAHIENEIQLKAFLTQIAFHKVIDERRANTLAQKRDLNREFSLNGADSQVPQPHNHDATPSQHLMADEELKKIQAELPHKLQWMIDCRLQGMTFHAIAEQGGVHERTVRRVFERVRRRIEET